MDEPPAWRLEDGHFVRDWTFPDFAAPLALAARIGAVAEEAGHHPEIRFGWGFLRVSLRTFDAGAVTELDHALAAAIDRLIADGAALPSASGMRAGYSRRLPERT